MSETRGSNLCTFCRRIYAKEHLSYDDLSPYDDVHYGDGGHEYKLPMGAESIIRDLQEELRAVKQLHAADLADDAVMLRDAQRTIKREIQALMVEYDMVDTIFGDKLLQRLQQLIP